MNQVIIRDKHDWHCVDFFQGLPLEEGTNSRGWAYRFVTRLMDDSFLFNNKEEKQKRNAQRRLKKMVTRAFKKYASGGNATKKTLRFHSYSMGTCCLLNMGWRARKIKPGEQVVIESN